MKSPDKLWTLSVVVSVIGLVDSLYLSAVKLMNTSVYCGGSANCETVNSSRYAEIFGIPIAFLGVAAYLAILVLLFLERKNRFWKENSPLVIFGMTLAGTLYSIYLTYIEIAVIRAICPYCVVSAIALGLLLVLAVIRLLKPEPEPKFASRGG